MRRTAVAFLLSVLAHPLALGLVLSLSWLTRTERPPRVQPRPVSLRTLSSRQWAHNRGGAELPARPEELHPKGQVVDVAPGNHQRPPHATYLAQTDNRVEQQSRAREQTSRYSVATPKNAPHPEVLPAARGRAAPRQAVAPVSLASRLERSFELGGRQPHLGSLLGSALAPEAQPGERASAGDEQRGADSATPVQGGGAPNDELRDVPEGAGTYLNTREWRFATFFNRVKQAVSAKWDPNGRLKEKDPRGRYLADRTTLLGVSLRADGSLADVYVAKSCGLDWLDREAVAAFERAAPFTNPPAALVEHGFIRFAFGFTITHEQNGLAPLMFRPGG